MLTKTNICSVRNYLGEKTDRQQFVNDIQNVDVIHPLKKFLRTPMKDHAFSLSFFRYFRAFIHNELFVSFRPLNFNCKINRIKPASCYYFIKIICNNKCYTQISLGVANYSKRQILCRHVNCLSRVSTYLRRRQRLRQIVVMCHIACWFSSGSVLKFDQFCHSSFF